MQGWRREHKGSERIEANLCLKLNTETLLAFSTLPPQPPVPHQVPLYCRYEALHVEGPSVDDNDPLSLDKLMKPNYKKPFPKSRLCH